MRAVLLGRADRQHEEGIGRDRTDLVTRERVPAADCTHGFSRAASASRLTADWGKWQAAV